jgi:hypothetical protein
MAYIVNKKGKVDLDKLKSAKEIANEMVSSNDFGFAYMNISKYANKAEDSARADIQLMKQFLEDSELKKRNFLNEEVNILEPDIIVTANLWDDKIDWKYLDLCFPEFKDAEPVKTIEGVARLYQARINRKPVKLLDLYYHFAAIMKQNTYFFEPIKQLFRSVYE